MIQTVYIAGPYTLPDPVENTRRASDAWHRLVDAGFVPYCPHTSMLLAFHKPRPYDLWLNQCLVWVSKCDAVLRLPGASEGADREVARAKELGIPVFDCIEDLEAARS